MFELRIETENKQDWFWLIIGYLKFRTFVLCLDSNPETSPDAFDKFIWPTLLDQMLASTTAAAVEALATQIVLNMN
ncbi:MAG TPA: hypothetical protein VIW64_16245 [Pyrinomonadaceae bacterium]|jgi:hypothetical protein